MKTAEEDHQNNFDLIRLVAALQVVYAHSTQWLGAPWPGALWPTVPLLSGVPIFFIVSGFLITGSLMRHPSLLAYFRNRALRIYPALLVNLLGISLMLATTGGLDPSRFWGWLGTTLLVGSDQLSLSILGYTVFQSGGFYPVFPSGVLWTLPIELSFYLVAPLVISLSGRFRGAAVLGALGLSLAYLAITSSNSAWPLHLPSYLWIFMIGAAARVYWPVIRSGLEGRAVFWTAAYLVAGFALQTGDYVYQYQEFAWQTAPLTTLMACAVLSCAFTARRLSARLLRSVDLSFGLYLWHMPVMWTFVGIGYFGGRAALISLLIALIIAAISWQVVERPALALRGRMTFRHAHSYSPDALN